jgi:epoxyqueuosine reductase
MDAALREALVRRLEPEVALVGFAPADRFGDAPENHRPADLCRDARTVIVFALAVPGGVFSSPVYGLHTMHRSYHTIYRRLDELSIDVCNFLESEGPHHAVPVPSYAPMVFEGMEPWGILSLKHAAVRAGLGAFGRSGQVYHPAYGSRLRFGAVVTSAELHGDPIVEADPCSPNCSACIKACPASAFDDKGEFRKLVCLGHTIKHAIYPIALKDEAGLRNIERVINTAGYDYWIACSTCTTACPNNRTVND